MKKLFRKKIDQVEIRRFEKLDTNLPSEEFRYEKYRDSLVNHSRWPDKTKDLSHYRFRFERNDCFRGLEFTCIDFPGERIADMVMGSEEYAVWSDTILQLFRDDTDYRALCEKFLKLLTAPKLDEKIVVQEYKVCLAKFLLNYKPLISPSVFALDRGGKTTRRGWTIDKIVENRQSGLSEDTQFAPLSAQAREANPALTEKFSERYKEYRAEVPDKVFVQLRRCDSLIVLVDVPGTLAANVGRLNDTEAVIEDLLKVCFAEKGKSMIETLYTAVRKPHIPSEWLFTKKISRIAFVAGKADLIIYDQVTQLESLLRQMVEKRLRDYDVKKMILGCSALSSTVWEKDRLYGYPSYTCEDKLIPPPSEPESEMTEITPDDLPDEWPDKWDEGQYCFPVVWPRMPKRKTKPPMQEGLNILLDFLIDIDRNGGN